MQLELISFKLCPYMHRVSIALKHLDIDHIISFVPPNDVPEWVRHASPSGQTPILKVNGDTILFESAVITEFVDDIATRSIQPADPVQRALNRGWTAYASDCIAGNFGMISAESESAFRDAHCTMLDKLDRLEKVLGDGPYFNGETFSLVDCAYAPLFVRLAENAKLAEMFSGQDMPKVHAWSEALREHPAAVSALPGDFPELYSTMLENLGGYLGSLVTD